MARLPKILTRLTRQLQADGHAADAAHEIAVAAMRKAGNLKQNSLEATAKGIKRGDMTPSQRAKDRAAKYSGGKPTDYVYHPKTNSTTKRKDLKK